MKKTVRMSIQKKMGVMDLLMVFGLLVVIGGATWFSIYKIHQREDLFLLQIALTDTILQAQKCLREGGIIQNVLQENVEEVYICNNQAITNATFPDLQKLSENNLPYKYIFTDKNKINVSLKGKIVLSCDVVKGFCTIN